MLSVFNHAPLSALKFSFAISPLIFSSAHDTEITTHPELLFSPYESRSQKTEEFTRALRKKFFPSELEQFKPLIQILQVIMSEDSIEIKQSIYKKKGYLKRFFSSETWTNWTEHRTALGTVIGFYADYLNGLSQLNAIVRYLDIYTITEANEQAARLLTVSSDAQSNNMVTQLPLTLWGKIRNIFFEVDKKMSLLFPSLPIASATPVKDNYPTGYDSLNKDQSLVIRCKDNEQRVAGTRGCYPRAPNLIIQEATCLVSDEIKIIQDNFCKSHELSALEMAQRQIQIKAQAGALMYCSAKLADLLDVLNIQFHSCSLNMIRPIPKLLSLILQETDEFVLNEVNILTIKVQDLAKKIIPFIEGLDLKMYGEMIDILLQTAKKFPNEDSITIPVLNAMIVIANKNAFFDTLQKEDIRKFAKRVAYTSVRTHEQQLGIELLNAVSAKGWPLKYIYNFLDTLNDDLPLLAELLPTSEGVQFFFIAGFIPLAALIFTYNRLAFQPNLAVPPAPINGIARCCGFFANRDNKVIGAAIATTAAVSTAGILTILRQ